MATEYVYLSGKVQWAKVREGQQDTKYEHKWCLDYFPDEEGAKTYALSGIEVGPSKAPQKAGGAVLVPTRYKLTRTCVDENDERRSPPEILIRQPDGTNAPFDPSRHIGNDSEVILKVEVFPYKKYGGGIGHRLAGILITKLVEYKPEQKDTPDEAKTRPGKRARPF